MSRFARFRYLVFLPYATLLLGTWVGGYFLNTVEARAVVVDSSTGDPVAGVPVAFGQRRTKTDAQGRYEVLDLPRGARLNVLPSTAYGDQTVTTDVTKVELAPSTLTVTVIQRNVLPETPVKKPEARQDDKLLASGTEAGTLVIAPYPVVGSKVLICAPDYRSQEIEARGTELTVGLVIGGTGCPPLPTPSPSPSPSPSASPAASPSPSAAPTPSPSGSP